MKSWLQSLEIYLRRPILAQFMLGIPSGLPLALTAGTLTVWLAESGISKSAIGIFAAVAVPYSLKFLWAPLLDGIDLPFLGKRRGWMIATQIMMAAAMVLMALSNPEEAPYLTGLAALLLSFSSASHDIAKDAYRVEILPTEMQGAGAAVFVLGYRVGNLFSTAGALYLATFFGWQMTYLLMAAIMLAFCITVLAVREPEASKRQEAEHHKTGGAGEWIRDFVITPFVEFLQRPQAITILLFILLYRMADAFLGVMANPFYIELGFSKIEIAEVVKIYGLLATILGSIIGGAVVFRLGVMRALWVGGIAASISNLMFVWQAHIGAEPYGLALTISLDNISGGLATAAFVAYMSKLCNLRFTATQYALLSSFAAFGRTWLSTPSGWAAEQLGWDGFFILSTAIGIPALLVLWRLSRTMRGQV
ncbi:MAG: AmpG family muropeptide MFS transporter [Alphaproteobacteria bacterium]|nr:AmpG family muropeptide MFS transporter [Alphaproteobacteria bacterium]